MRLQFSHDIGKAEQYERTEPLTNSPESVSPRRSWIRFLLMRHFRGGKTHDPDSHPRHRRLRTDAEPLEWLLYTSDKASRTCFACPAESKCDWSAEKKNMELKV